MTRYSAFGLELEIDENPPPCLYCRVPVTTPSMSGCLVCPPCDMGRNADGSFWSYRETETMMSNARAYMDKYKVREQETKDA